MLFLRKKKMYFRSVAKLKLSHDVTWTVLPMYLLRFRDWEHFSCVAVYAGSDSAPISSKIS